MFDFPLFPKISMLEWSMKICSDSLPDFSNVGAIVMAGKLVLKSMMPLLVRSNRSVCFWGLYSMTTFSPSLLEITRFTCWDFVASMSRFISRIPRVSVGKENDLTAFEILAWLTFFVSRPLNEISSGDGLQMAKMSPLSSLKREMSRGNVFALLYWRVGTSAAYCQLDIQPISTRLPSGALFQLTVA